MNIYLQDAGISKNLKHLSTTVKAFPNEQFTVTFFAKNGVSIPLLLALISHKSVTAFHVVLNASCISLSLIRVVNSNSKIFAHIIVDSDLTTGEWKRICKIDGVVCIVDTIASESNQTLYKSNRNIVLQTAHSNEILYADIFQIMAYQLPVYQCHYSSCLGKTLFIDKDSKLYFCPYHKQETYLGELTDIASVWEADAFFKVLEQSVQHREQCKTVCAHFPLCKGGCPLEDDCAEFKELVSSATKELNEIIQERRDLSTLPLYKENAVLINLSRKIFKLP